MVPSVGKQCQSQRPSSPSWIMSSPRKLDKPTQSLGVGPTSAVDGVLCLKSMALPDKRRLGVLPPNPSPRRSPMASMGLTHAEVMGPGICREDSAFNLRHNYVPPRSPRAAFGPPRPSSSRPAKRFKTQAVRGAVSPGPAYGAVSSFTANTQVARRACLSPANKARRPRSAAAATRLNSASLSRSKLFDQGRPASPSYSMGGRRPAPSSISSFNRERAADVMWLYRQMHR